MAKDGEYKLRIEEIRDDTGISAMEKPGYTWHSNDEGLSSSSYLSSAHGHYGYDNTINGLVRDDYNSYGTAASESTFGNRGEIQMRSSQETNEYLNKLANEIYRDPNPQIIRRAAIQPPITYEQQIQVRYLQPPAVPAPGPLVIKEVRPPQPPPPAPLVIYEQPRPSTPPPPLILRERPPTPPSYVPSETITRQLPPVPVPPRSVIIRRFPPPPEKPRDILIERWLPYGPPPERQTIVEPAPPPHVYPKPRYEIVLYDSVHAQTVRRFEKLGFRKEDPADYIARYGSSLLDSETLLQRARSAGVYEDLSPPLLPSSSYMDMRGTYWR